MSSPTLEVIQLTDTGDPRGSSFSLPAELLSYLARVEDCHIMTIKPGCIRGNHYHQRRREILLRREAEAHARGFGDLDRED